MSPPWPDASGPAGHHTPCMRKTRTLRPGLDLRTTAGQNLSDGDAETGPHQADAVEVGLFPGALLGALARVVPFIQEFHFFQFLERLGQQALGLFELDTKFVSRARQVFPALDRGLGV